MARTSTNSSQLPRPVLLSSVGLLARYIPLPQVSSALTKHGREGQRTRSLPASFLVYYIVALSLYMPYSLREVLRCVVEGLRHMKMPGLSRFAIATKGGISRARSRLGWEVMATLASQIMLPLATRKSRGAWYRGKRVLALDGTTLAVPATAENISAFGLHGSKEGDSAFPLVRLAAMVEVGTHAILNFAFDACATSELSLANKLLPMLSPDNILLEDRGFVGYPWWQQVRTTGAQVLCRVRSNMRFAENQLLSDGSYLSVLRPPKKSDGNPITVRVIAYKLHGVPKGNTIYRLVTSILDPKEAPAVELAALYHERWEAESTFDEFKTHMRGGAHVILRSKTPDLVRQEIYGFLLAHYTIRAIMHEAALQIDEDPDKISFIHTIRVVRRKFSQAAEIFPPEAMETLDTGNN